MDQILDSHKKEFDQAVDHLKDELITLRVGRANPIMVENIPVEAYGARTPLKQIASITVPSARLIVIQPWDKSTIKEVEKAIIKADIGINPVNEGQQIRLVIPQLTEESRKELVKSVGERVEKSRVAIRQIRDKIKEEIIKKEKEKQISEDSRFTSLKKLDELVKDYNDQIKVIGERKEAEIMEI